jgi:hypothetical protein
MGDRYCLHGQARRHLTILWFWFIAPTRLFFLLGLARKQAAPEERGVLARITMAGGVTAHSPVDPAYADKCVGARSLNIDDIKAERVVGGIGNVDMGLVLILVRDCEMCSCQHLC